MKKVLKNYGFIITMLIGIIAGCVMGWAVPKSGNLLAPLGTIFTNLMFCVVVPMVFCSIASAIANMQSMKRAGKIMGVTLVTFFVTAAIAAIIMYIIARIFPIVPSGYTNIEEATEATSMGIGDLIVNFFTVSDFSGLLSRRAILPLIVMAVIFGFGV